MTFVRTASAVLILWATPPEARAAFQDRSFGARAVSLGSAFAAVADDSTAMFTNPAGIAQIPQPGISMMYAKPFAGLDALDIHRGHLAAASPTRWGAAGVGATSIAAENLIQEYRGIAGCAVSVNSLRRIDEEVHTSVQAGGGKRSQRSLYFSRGSYPDLLVGLNIAYLFHSYPIGRQASYAQDPAFAGGISRTALGLDAGLLLKISPRLSFGLAGRNLNRPNVGVSTQDRVARDVQGGIQWKLHSLAVSADGLLHQPSISASVWTWHLGAEIPLQKTMALRAGLQTDAATAGLGIRITDGFSLDYATQIIHRFLQSNYGAHQLELNYRFGSVRKMDGTSAPDKSWLLMPGGGNL